MDVNGSMHTVLPPEIPTHLRRLLADRKRVAIDNERSIACAVLVPLVAVGDGYGVLYTLRSEHLPNHKGQVAFPGGKRSIAEDASLHDTALREAREEIGLRAEDVDVLGTLDDVYTMATDFVITPFVGLLRVGARYQPNPAEVDEVFTVSFEDLVDNSYREKETKEWKGHRFEVDVITAGPHRIWGATHSITLNLLDCVVARAR
jgi:8-oxo-dGTP pyrophosphatase MutT (NUDIX family)